MDRGHPRAGGGGGDPLAVLLELQQQVRVAQGERDDARRQLASSYLTVAGAEAQARDARGIAGEAMVAKRAAEAALADERSQRQAAEADGARHRGRLREALELAEAQKARIEMLEARLLNPAAAVVRSQATTRLRVISRSFLRDCLWLQRSPVVRGGSMPVLMAAPLVARPPVGAFVVEPEPEPADATTLMEAIRTDDQLPEGQPIHVPGHGLGSYVSIERSMFGANNHAIIFHSSGRQMLRLRNYTEQPSVSWVVVGGVLYSKHTGHLSMYPYFP